MLTDTLKQGLAAIISGRQQCIRTQIYMLDKILVDSIAVRISIQFMNGYRHFKVSVGGYKRLVANCLWWFPCIINPYTKVFMPDECDATNTAANSLIFFPMPRPGNPLGWGTLYQRHVLRWGVWILGLSDIISPRMAVSVLPDPFSCMMAPDLQVKWLRSIANDAGDHGISTFSADVARFIISPVHVCQIAL